MNNRKIPIFLVLFAFLVLIFVVLAYKNPFSVQSTLANLEPYPDTLYYAYPAWNLVHGGSFTMQYGSMATKIIVPPVYSIYLIPFFYVVRDVRFFYIANIVLAILSLVLLMRILYKLLLGEKWSIYPLFLCGLVYVTSFYIFTLPSLLMAENITLFCTTVGLYLLIFPLRRYSLPLMGCAVGILMLIKFSNLPIAGAFSALYLWKAWRSGKKDMIRLIVWLCVSAGIIFVYVLVSGILVGHKNLNGTDTFALKHFFPNLKHYFSVIIGTQTSFLWFNERLMSPLIALLAIGGVIIGTWVQKWRSLTFSMLFLILSTVLFMSFFPKVDGRYLIGVFPAFIILTGVFLHACFSRIGRVHTHAPLLLTLALILVYLVYPGFGYVRGEQVMVSLRKQVGLNFKHKADPWNYHAVQNLNAYFDKPMSQKPYVGTVLPPFYVALYANGNYEYLPLSLGQEFYSSENPFVESTMGSQSIIQYYEKLLQEGNDIYVTNIYLGNVAGWGIEFENLSKHFSFQKVKEGCMGSCNIYKVEKR